MAKIVLMNFDEEQGLRLAAFLRMERHEVVCALPKQTYLGWLHGQDDDADLVILDASYREKAFRQILEDIAARRARNGPRPMILCISRQYRGPQFQLDIERKGARLVYV
jgi:DNA-binding response OmpR family regulator